jgi:dCMP deaminase
MRDNTKLLTESILEASKSSCLSKRVGALIVIDGEIAARGFNDTAQGAKCGAGGCLRCQLRATGTIKTGEDRNTCLCVHAEINAIAKLESQKLAGNGNLEMFVTIPPCVPCAEAIIGAGVSKIFYPVPDHDGAGILYLRNQGIQALGLD